MPSLMTSAEEASVYAAPAGASSGLIAPQFASSGSLARKGASGLAPSKSFASAPVPSRIPDAANAAGDVAPTDVPGLPEGSEPLQPPAFRDAMPSAPVLQEPAASPDVRIPGNHLALDPTVSTVLFTHGSGNIDESVLPTLDKLVVVLNGNPDVRISLISYADNVGSTTREARRLSLARALAVRDYLSSKGVSESRVDVHAEGANTFMGYMDRVDVKVNN
jgi:outer membrane protein OmpA-like peptidoglycan-associated protein